MHCYNCGKEIDDKAVVCVGCGVAVKPVKPQEKKLSGLQIAAYILFGLQLLAFIGLGLQYDFGVVGTVIGYLAFTIVGVICLVVDNKKTKGVVSEGKGVKQEQLVSQEKKPMENASEFSLGLGIFSLLISVVIGISAGFAESPLSLLFMLFPLAMNVVGLKLGSLAVSNNKNANAGIGLNILSLLVIVIATIVVLITA